MRRIALTRSAERDLVNIFNRSAKDFGLRARDRYEGLVAAALATLQDNPCALGGVNRSELAPGIWTYHLRHCRRPTRSRSARVGSPRHLIVYEFDEDRVLVLRVLHDAMDIARRIGANEIDEPVG